jgi:hypothetical protein
MPVLVVRYVGSHLRWEAGLTLLMLRASVARVLASIFTGS